MGHRLGWIATGLAWLALLVVLQGVSCAAAPAASPAPAQGVTALYGRMAQAPSPPGTGPVSWTSSNPAVASVDAQGRVTLIRRGTATVTGVRGSARQTFAVTVTGFSKLARTVGNRACAVDDARTGIYCWGQNLWTLPYPATAWQPAVPAPQRIAPGDIPASARIADVAMGTFAACALTEAGTVHCFGSGGPHVPLGRAITPPAPQTAQPPVQVTLPGGTAAAIAVGPSTACAGTSAGELYCWGWAQQIPQAGPIRTNVFKDLPMLAARDPAQGAGKIESVAASTNGGCIVAGGDADCWGGVYPPAKFETGDRTGAPLTAVLSDDFTCALDSNGQTYCAGRAFGARYGRGQAPFLISKAWLAADQSGSGPFKALSMGQIANVSCGLSQAGDAWCWGKSHMGSAGDGQTPDHDVLRPTQTLRGARPQDVAYVDISCGAYHCVALGDDGRLYGWGSNQGMVLGPDPTGKFPSAAQPVLLAPPR